MLDQHIGYWKQQLEGAPELLELPTDRPRPAVQTHHGASVGLVVSRELTAKVNELCRAEGASLFMLLLAVFKVLLARYSGQEDICVGTPIAGRDRVETEGLIGFFVNMLVLRTDLSGNPTARELIRQVRDAALGAYAHQELPFERLVDELQVERSLSHAPLFQVVFSFHNTSQELLELPDLSLSAAGEPSNTTKADLLLRLSESGETISGGWEYNTDLFDESTIKRLVDHFKTLLESFVSEPAQRLSELQMLTEAEQQRVLYEWAEADELATKRHKKHKSEGTVDVPDTVSECLQDVFEAQVERTPEAIAVIFDGTNISFRELNNRANQLAHHLQSAGVREESLVGILVERSVEMLVAILGVLKAGGAYVPLDPSYPRERLSFMLEDAGVAVLLTQHHLAHSFEARSFATLYLDRDSARLAELSTDNPARRSVPANAAYVIYTSGSTGKPKGVVVPHAGAVNLGRAWLSMFDVRPGTRVLQCVSLSFDASVWELLVSVMCGATLCVPKPGTQMAGDALYEVLKQQAIELMVATPTVLATVESEGLPRLRTVAIGGEACTAELAARWSSGRSLINVYGPTETSVIATIAGLDGEHQPSIGRPIANMQAYVLDKYMQPVAPGLAGELYLGGIGVTRGYLNRAELTAERFMPHPYSLEPGARLYRTGDVARWRADGELECLGRMDDQVKLRGFRIELGEIANALREQAGVSECVVVALGEGEEKRLVAYVVADEGVNAAELREELKQRLPAHMIPSALVRLAELPLTKNGKLDRRALPAPEEVTSDAETNFVELRTPVEEILAGIWSDVLLTTRIGVNDNFFELGGHSLLAMQVISRIREAFGIDTQVHLMFVKPTLALLAAEVEQQMYRGRSVQAPPVVRTSRDIELPLSFAQQRLWFIDRFTPESPLYNMPMAVRLTGALNLAALERTLREIVRRHEALRTNFVTVEGKPVQVIRLEAYADEFCLPVVDLSSRSKALREAEVRRLARAEAVRPFDLETDSLLRATVLRLDARQHIVLLTLHHIIFDGWSMGVFVKEVAALYKAFSQGLESPLAELPVQYADYAVWQREWLQGEVLDQHIGYWKQQLEGAPELLELPLDRPRPAVQTHRGANVGMLLSPELTEKVRELCRAEGVTLFMLLLAAFKVLLVRYSGQEDISVGTPIAGRNRVETEGLIGFFVNTLVLRTELAGNPTARELLRRVRNVALGAYAHQELPFEKLVDELQVERSLSHTPLFQVLFVLQNAGGKESLELPGLSLSAAGESSGVAKFDLTLSMSESGEAISGVCEYNTDLFDETTIKRLMGHFETLLESIVSDPAQRLSELQMLTEAEQQRTLCEWSKGSDEAMPELCLQDLFEAQVERTPEAIALVFDQQEISYRELNSRANQLAHYLQSQGVREESLVGILVERSVEMLVGVLGVLKAGAAYVPLDPSYPQERLSFMAADAGIEVLLTQHHHRLDTASFQTLCLDSEWPQIAEHSTDNPVRRSVPANTAYVIYTSGSTGRPKGVVVPHAGAVNFSRARLSQLGVRSGTRVLQCASLSFDASAGELFVSLLNGATLCVPKPETQMAGNALFEVLQQQEIELLFITPAALATVDSDGLPRLRTVVAVGEACPAELAARWSTDGRRFINGYGPTETTVIAIMSGSINGERQPPIGRPIANMQAYVLDKHMQPVAVGVAGELYLGGLGVTRGYLNRPDLTAERFVPHPFSREAGARLYRTGDFVRYLADGELEYIGRIDEQVKLRGLRIELTEIEAVLLQHESVREAVVVVRADESGERRIVAYLVSQTSSLTTSELRLHAKQFLPEYMVPSAFVQLESLPLTPVGKLDKQRLPAPTNQRPSLTSEYVKPQTETEQTITAVWQELLHLSEVGTIDNFFDLGGNSLLLIQLHARLQEIFGEQLTVIDLFKHPTIGSLAARLSHEEPQPEHEAAHFETRMTGKQRLRERLEQRKRVA
ncbi:MAG TPA: amino acid adenylation domain-containing protein [Pyrinomonadaceae bacterium]